MGLLLSELTEGTIYLCQLSGRKMLITSRKTEVHKITGQPDKTVYKLTAFYYDEAHGEYTFHKGLHDHQLIAIP